MLAVRRSCLGSALLLLAAACDDQPLEPSILASASQFTPAVPSNLTATAVSSSQIDVAWQDNSGNEGGFEVWVAITGVSSFNLWTTTGPNVTRASFTGIGGEQEYCAKARAFTTRGNSGKIAGYSDFSNIACASTALPPNAPLGAQATPLNSDAVSVGWFDNSNNEDGFRVERSLDSLTWTIVGSTKGSVTYLQDGGLTSERRVCYRVIAFNAHGDSPPTADCTTPPAAPSDLTATGVATPAIDLAWTENSAVEDGYEVWRSPVEVDYYTYVVIATLPPNSIAYHDAGVSGNTRYWYYVRAKKDNGYSSRSNTANALAATALPNAPSGTDAIPTGSSSVQVTWTDNSGNEDGFRVERSLDGGVSWGVAGTRAASDYSPGWFADAERASDQVVCYRIIAFNGLGDSPASNVDCTAPPAAPTGLVAATAADVAIDLTWTDNSSVEDGYEVRQWYCDYSYWEPYCYYFPVASLGPNATTYHATGLSPGEAYTYVVVATKDGGSSDPSNDATAWSTVPPDAPTDLTATAVSSGQVDLAWTDNSSNEESFAILRCTSVELGCADYIWIASVDANVTMFSDTSVLAGTTYIYQVFASIGGLYSDPSNQATVTTP
jgi:hypothetical protein